MTKIEGEGVQDGGPLEVRIEHEDGKPGWVRLTTEVTRKKKKKYLALVRLEDLKLAVEKL